MQKSRSTLTLRVFLLALLMGLILFLPFLIYDRGYFIYYGDFNVQQIPFYQLAHEAVRSGDLWSWNTDLGANFIGSYSFYLLFSPFFWLTLPFPNSIVPLLMAPLLILKTACAALTAHLYLRRMLREERFAALGALLYAFSGWMSFNIFFNHFHEVAVFFPLLLLGLELLVRESKHGLLAVAVLLNACVNYWFFVGEAVFVILYVLVRSSDRSWGLTLPKFCRIAFESVLGFACAAAVVLPSVMALMGNPRTGGDELLTGWNLWIYWHEQRPLAILQSFLFPPEMPARTNFFPDHGAKWASLSAWLPLFSLTGVLAYFFRRRHDWLKKMLALCLLFAMIPGLNSLFILLNQSYYARWFYMPILLMALATARALEDAQFSTAEFARACKWTGVLLVALALMCGLTPNYNDEEELVFGLAKDAQQMWIYAAIALTCLAIVTLLVVRLRHHRRFYALTLASIMVVCCGFNIYYIANGKYNRERSRWLIDVAIRGADNISLPYDSEEFNRIDIYDDGDRTENLGMFWRRPTIQAFHSIVPTSLMEFYPTVGVTRDVASRPETDYYALRPLLSVRWFFAEAASIDEVPMPGYHYYDTQNGFDIYENDLFLPMGFTYDHYLTSFQLEDVTTQKRSNVILRAVVLEEDAAERNADILSPLPDEGYEGFTEEAMEDDVAARSRYTADSFTVDGRGFTATTSFDSAGDQLLFFSVPYNDGWSATINGQPVAIEKVNIGFMGIRVPAGEQTIRFDYFTPGLREGLLISAGGLLVLVVYLLLAWLHARRHAPVTEQPNTPQEALAQGQSITMSPEQFHSLRGNPAERAARLQRALEEADTLRKAQEDAAPKESD